MPYPLEQLLNQPDYKRTYLLLSYHFSDIIPYVGTGLSFYYKSWGEPFRIILHDLRNDNQFEANCFYIPLNRDQRSRAGNAMAFITRRHRLNARICLAECLQIAINKMNETRPQNQINDIYDANGQRDNDIIWENLDTLYRKKQYIELGELINIISMTIRGISFNKLFFNVLTASFVAKAEEIASAEERIMSMKNLYNQNPLPEAVWYIPYLGNESRIVFTTNTDGSLNRVYRHAFGNAPVTYHSRSAVEEIMRTVEEHRVAYHIHGYQFGKEIDTSNTFIMTWSDYQKAYTQNEGSPLRMILDYARSGHFLFIGASLEKDATVEQMKRIIQELRITNKHVAFFRKEERVNAQRALNNKRIDLTNNMATQILLFPDYHQYSSVLCQLIRENTQEEWGVYAEIARCQETMGGAFSMEVSSFLESNESFSTFNREINEDELNTLLYPELKKCIVENEERSFRWSVCRVAQEGFAFPIKESNNTCLLETYSAPLGNTIYIIGGSNLTEKARNSLADSIKNWTLAHEKGYWTPNNALVKVRVFLVNAVGDMTPNTIVKQLFDIISEDDILTRIISLKELISKMKQYREYSTVVSIFDGLKELNDKSVFHLIGVLVCWIAGSKLFSNMEEQVNELQSLISERAKIEYDDSKKLIRVSSKG